MKLVIVVVGMYLSLAGCAGNPYKKYYTDTTHGVDVSKDPRFVQSNGNPTWRTGTEPSKDNPEMLENGYGLVGYSSFYAPNASTNDALAQAKAVHASTVILYQNYRDTVTGSMPITTPNVQTTTTSVSGTSYGASGLNSFNGTGYSTTYGSQTTYVPYSVTRYDFLASYWIEQKPPVLGVQPLELTDDQKAMISSNKGIQVGVVIKSSPAYMADILKGDVIRKIGGVEILDPKHFFETIHQFAGQSVDIAINRNGKAITKTVTLSPDPTRSPSSVPNSIKP